MSDGEVAARPDPFTAWWAASRPKTLSVSMVPVAVGTALATQTGPLLPERAVVAAATALLLQLACNWINDYADFESGADAEGRLGPPRAAAMGWIEPAVLRRAAVLALLGAGGLGFWLAAQAGWVLLVPGGFALLAAWAYTAGPWPLGYHGLGDAAVFLFFGLFAVTASSYLHTDAWLPLAAGAALPVGLLATLVLAVNNLRDVSTDELVGKQTLAVRLGEAGARRYAQGLLAGSFIALCGLPLLGSGLAAPLLPILSLPLAWRLVHPLRHARGTELNPILAGAARLQLVFGSLLTLGFLLPF
ncbi:MAG: 1,4-dihydroxy-2-naphthoate octaprenyltransferase [bacterium]|nr:1,4-dihydroxy-2-naphthoate octaprenyltransferase [bacterium]